MKFILLTVIIICVFIFKILNKNRKRKFLKQEQKNNIKSSTVIAVAESLRHPEKQKNNIKSSTSVTYKQLLTRNEWKEKVEKIKARDNNCCRYCKSKYNLQVHHKYYLQYPDHEKVLPWEYKDDALITLCDKCHKKWHDTHTIKVYYISRNYKNQL